MSDNTSNNWDILRDQSCGGHEECNCFLSNDWIYGYDFNDESQNTANWNALKDWLVTQNAKTVLTVAEMKQLALRYKNEVLDNPKKLTWEEKLEKSRN